MKRYNKLVRDKIPAICEANGDIPHTRILDDDRAYQKALTDKLCEEAAEVKESPSLEELADTLEVLLTMGKSLGFTPEQIEAARLRKAKERGGFDKRVLLVDVSPKQ